MLREQLTDSDLGDVQIQEFGSARDVLIRVGRVGADDAGQQAIVDKVRTALGQDFTVRRVETVGPSVSSELVRQSILALVLGAVVVLIYLWFRFEWQFAVARAGDHGARHLRHAADLFGAGDRFRPDVDCRHPHHHGLFAQRYGVVYDRIREMLRRYKKIPCPSCWTLR